VAGTRSSEYPELDDWGAVCQGTRHKKGRRRKKDKSDALRVGVNITGQREFKGRGGKAKNKEFGEGDGSWSEGTSNCCEFDGKREKAFKPGRKKSGSEASRTTCEDGAT